MPRRELTKVGFTNGRLTRITAEIKDVACLSIFSSENDRSASFFSFANRVHILAWGVHVQIGWLFRATRVAVIFFFPRRPADGLFSPCVRVRTWIADVILKTDVVTIFTACFFLQRTAIPVFFPILQACMLIVRCLVNK